MKRYIATLFRGKWLYALMLLLLLAGTVVGTRQLLSAYASTARLWFDEPPLANILNPNQQQSLESPAEQHSDLLYQLLQTDSFMTSVLKGTNAANLLTGIPAEDGRTLDKFRTIVSIGVVGNNTLEISATGDDPVLCQQLVTSTVQHFQDWTYQSRTSQSSTTTQYYQQQVDSTQQQMDEARKQLDKFTADHPGINESDTVLYLQLQSLQQAYDTARADHATALNQLSQASIVNNVSGAAGNGAFRIIDQPVVPTDKHVSLKQQLKYLAMGIVASFGLVIAVVTLVTWQDTTVRTREDAAAVSDIPVLAVVPHLPDQEHRRAGQRVRGRRRAADQAHDDPGRETRSTLASQRLRQLGAARIATGTAVSDQTKRN